VRGGQTDRQTGGQTEQIVGRVEGISVDRDSTIVHGPAVRAVATSDRLDQKLRLNAHHAVRVDFTNQKIRPKRVCCDCSVCLSICLSLSLSLFLPFGV